MKWAHDALVNDLAGHLSGPGRLLWCDMQLGPAGSPRPDVYTIEKSFAHPNCTAHECKISASDFRADVTAGKWQKYLTFAKSVVFCFPAGLVDPADVPRQCGVMVRSERGWSTRRRPIPQTMPDLPLEAWLKLLIDGCKQEGMRFRAKEFSAYVAREKIRNRFGDDVANYLNRRETAEMKERQRALDAQRIIDQANVQAKKITQDVAEALPELWGNLVNILGLEPDANVYEVRSAVRRITRSAEDARSAVSEANAMLAAMREVVNKYRGILV